MLRFLSLLGCTKIVQSKCGSVETVENIEPEYGGASRDRTDDLIVANDALSQLSYSPVRIVSEVPDYFISLRTQLPTFAGFRGFQSGSGQLVSKKSS
jgi:hypothetical protein